MKYFKEAKEIWKNEVPKTGQSETLQGELIRAIEKLRYESQDNGNVNWDSSFELFCSLIEEILLDDKTFQEEELRDIKSIMLRIQNYNDPYIDDDIYDELTDYCIVWSRKNGFSIPYQGNPNQCR